MNIIITEENATEHGHCKWAAEASELGLPPGVVPKTLETTLGNKQPFLLETANESAFIYWQGNGCLQLIIWND